MKIIKTIGLAIIISIFFYPVIAYCSTLNIPETISQGSTLEIKIPKYDIKEVTGIFNEKSLTFYEIEKKPNWDEPINRAEFLKLMFDNYNFGEITILKAIEFPDVPKDNPYYDYINKASALDIIHGYEDGLFRPYIPIERSHIAKILILAFNPEQEVADIPEFPDVSEDHWHYEYIREAVGAGYFQGYPDGFMRPDRNINFLEAEIVIKRAANIQEFTGINLKKYFRTFAGLHRTDDIGEKILSLTLNKENGENEDISDPINVIEREYPIISFTLPETKTQLFGKQEQNTTWQMINEAKANPNNEQLWEGKFIVPTDGVITLGFGDKLYINGSYSGSHFGIDYANDEGTPIYASNNGIVTLANETMSYGNTIIIDHGQNVFTMYLHMSELKVEKGANLKKGDLIGLMGSTGIASGSHLHFNHFIGDVIVDSNEWYENEF